MESVRPGPPLPEVAGARLRQRARATVAGTSGQPLRNLLSASCFVASADRCSACGVRRPETPARSYGDLRGRYRTRTSTRQSASPRRPDRRCRPAKRRQDRDSTRHSAATCRRTEPAPRARGDGPSSSNTLANALSCSPRPRGWSLRPVRAAPPGHLLPRSARPSKRAAPNSNEHPLQGPGMPLGGPSPIPHNIGSAIEEGSRSGHGCLGTQFSPCGNDGSDAALNHGAGCALVDAKSRLSRGERYRRSRTGPTRADRDH